MYYSGFTQHSNVKFESVGWLLYVSTLTLPAKSARLTCTSRLMDSSTELERWIKPISGHHIYCIAASQATAMAAWNSTNPVYGDVWTLVSIGTCVESRW